MDASPGDNPWDAEAESGDRGRDILGSLGTCSWCPHGSLMAGHLCGWEGEVLSRAVADRGERGPEMGEGSRELPLHAFRGHRWVGHQEGQVGGGGGWR